MVQANPDRYAAALLVVALVALVYVTSLVELEACTSVLFLAQIAELSLPFFWSPHPFEVFVVPWFHWFRYNVCTEIIIAFFVSSSSSGTLDST